MRAGGAVAAGDVRTADAGAEVLRAGGNAVDAACAAAFMSFVVEPPLSSPGGAGVALFGSPRAGFQSLDFFSRTPGLGAQPRELDFHAITVDFGATTQQFHVGRGAAAVPTAMPGLLKLHELGGKMPLVEVVAQAVSLARAGFSFSKQVAWVVDLLQPIMTLSPGMDALFCRDGVPAKAGEILKNPALASFLEQTARAPEETLRGAFVDEILRRFGPDQGGLLSAADMSDSGILLTQPLALHLDAETTVLTQPPPSSGGSLIALALRLCDGLGLEAASLLSAPHLLGVAEIMRTVSAARAAGFDAQIREATDPSALLTKEAVDRWRGSAQAGQQERSLGSTTHISVIDGAQGAASITLSNGEGCGHAVEPLGFQLNNFLGEEDINPSGFHALPAGVKMTTMMAPTLALRDGSPFLVLGSGGSNRIRSAIFQALVATLIQGHSLKDAISAARVHVEGDHLSFEDVDLQAGTADALTDAFSNHARFPERSLFFGGVNAVSMVDGVASAEADERRGGGVSVV